MMLEGKIEDLRGSIQYKCASQEHKATGAVLSFDKHDGVKLEWTGEENLVVTLKEIEGAFLFNVFVPILDVVQNRTDNGGTHFEAIGRELFASFENADPRGRQCSSLRVNYPLLNQYINSTIPSWNPRGNYNFSYNWETVNVSLGVAFPEGASVSICINAIAENNLFRGVSLRARPQIEVEFDAPIQFENARSYGSLLREFFELLSSRPSEELVTRFVLDASIVVLREPIGRRDLNMNLRIPLTLQYSLCARSLQSMIRVWLTKIGRSPAASHLLRLLYYPDLPIDLRYFMAFSALGYLNVEQNHAGKHRPKIRELDHLRAFNAWWNILVPNVDNLRLGKYLERVANTRHNIAHLSRPDHQILSSENDLLRGFHQLHVLARGCLFKCLGLPSAECLTYITSQSGRLLKEFGPVPQSLFV
jgi:hypothetical protein